MSDKEEHNKEGGDDHSDNEDSHSRKFSNASVSSTDANEEEVEEDEEKKSIVLGPQLALKEQLELDKDDESLRRWKEQLLGSVDLEDVGGETLEPEVHIMSLTIVSPGRPELVLPIPFVPNPKGYAFALKDGSQYTMKFSFTVCNNIVSGLRYTNTVWKAGVRGIISSLIFYRLLLRAWGLDA